MKSAGSFKGDAGQTQMKSGRAAIGMVKHSIKHVDLYKFPSGQKSGASKPVKAKVPQE